MTTTESNNINYNKYKQRYLSLKYKEPFIDNFYFVHNTRDINNIISIIKDGVLKIGRHVDKSNRKHSGGIPQDYIYTNIFFDDIRNLSHYISFSILLHSNIIHKYGAVFNRGWQTYPSKMYSTYFYKKDTPTVFNKKIEEIKEFIQDPNTLPWLVREAPEVMHHEVLFKHNITLKDSLIGIVCNWCSDEQIAMLKKLLKKYGYGDIKIAQNNSPLSLKDIGID
jgi:hypothetical protein